jgi:hypothetical protein
MLESPKGSWDFALFAKDSPMNRLSRVIGPGSLLDPLEETATEYLRRIQAKHTFSVSGLHAGNV